MTEVSRFWFKKTVSLISAVKPGTGNHWAVDVGSGLKMGILADKCLSVPVAWGAPFIALLAAQHLAASWASLSPQSPTLPGCYSRHSVFVNTSLEIAYISSFCLRHVFITKTHRAIWYLCTWLICTTMLFMHAQDSENVIDLVNIIMTRVSSSLIHLQILICLIKCIRSEL